MSSRLNRFAIKTKFSWLDLHKLVANNQTCRIADQTSSTRKSINAEIMPISWIRACEKTLVSPKYSYSYTSTKSNTDYRIINRSANLWDNLHTILLDIVFLCDLHFSIIAIFYGIFLHGCRHFKWKTYYSYSLHTYSYILIPFIVLSVCFAVLVLVTNWKPHSQNNNWNTPTTLSGQETP